MTRYPGPDESVSGKFLTGMVSWEDGEDDCDVTGRTSTCGVLSSA